MTEVEKLPLFKQFEARDTNRARLWHLGRLEWKFHGRPTQRRIYDYIRARWKKTPYTMLCVHRRAGKSSIGFVLCLETCLRIPNARVAIIAMSKVDAEGIISDVMEPMLIDCPPTLRPRRIKNDFIYQFDHNQSRITLYTGEDKRVGRGRRFDFVLFDEAAFISNLRHLSSSVFGPALREPTGKVFGSMLIMSTRPEEPDHEFDKMFTEAEANDLGLLIPLSQSTDSTPEFIADCERMAGGRETVDFRREFECEVVFASEETVVPEATSARIAGTDGKPPLVRAVERPVGADRYNSLDPGGRDLTGLLWGYYYFTDDLLVIEDELALKNMTSDDLAAKVHAKEAALWPENQGELTRIGDNSNTILLYDLWQKYDLRYQLTAKDNKDAQINLLRVAIRDGRVAIHPRCTLLIKTLQIARRSALKYKGFERMKEIGHADLLDCLLYLMRNVKRRQMPTLASATPRMPTDFMAPLVVPAPRKDALVRAFGLNRFRR